MKTRTAGQGRIARLRGFTLIELLIVLAIVGTLLTIAVPSYFASLDNAKDTALRQSLSVMRTAIDHFKGDTGRYPESLQELVSAKYLRSIPADPITGATDQWQTEMGAGEAGQAGGVRDVRSNAPGNGKDGTPYASW
jgi:type II secretion system protein G